METSYNCVEPKYRGDRETNQEEMEHAHSMLHFFPQDSLPTPKVLSLPNCHYESGKTN